MTSRSSTPCPHADSLPPRRHVCADCQRERKRAQARQHYLETREQTLERMAVYYAEHREERKAFSRAYHAAHREELNAKDRERYYRDHEATLERKRREREAIRRDPERMAALREYRRMWMRLHRERQGRPMAPVPEERYPAASTKWTTDAEPLRALVHDAISVGWTRSELASSAGVSERLLYRLLHENCDGVTVAAADRVAVALGLHLDLI